MYRHALMSYCFKRSVNASFTLHQHGCKRLNFLPNSHLNYHQYRFNVQLVSRSDDESRNKVHLSEDFKRKFFNTKLWESEPSFLSKKIGEAKIRHERIVNPLKYGEKPHPAISVKYLADLAEPKLEEQSNLEERNEVNLPFAENLPSVYPKSSDRTNADNPRTAQGNRGRTAPESAVERSQVLQLAKDRVGNWMSDYEFYEEDLTTLGEPVPWQLHYGTPDPEEPVSKIPCGGCGARLQCKETSIPGYLPSEIFKGRHEDELKSLVCQRCHFLKQYNVAIDVRVSQDEYPKILSQIKNKRAAVILLIDLLDFPCSIWPGIMDIIGSKRPVVIVGNKVDLIPGDHQGYLLHLQKTLEIHVQKMGVSKGNIQHTALISARTGFGVEDLITQLHKLWHYKSDFYLIGCTNVGKSTLFNALLQSDFCKVQAVDLVQRATTSVWPGTTLNLLKFPVLRPEGWRLAARIQRLKYETTKGIKESRIRKEQLSRRRLYYMPSFIQYVGRTFQMQEEPARVADLFSVPAHCSTAADDRPRVGIDETALDFAKGRWCYDTPGVMHPDQILNLLTTDELVKVLPTKTINPRYFTMKPGKTLFIAGLGRLDFLEGLDGVSVRFSVFSSEDLPVTVTSTENADYIYKELLGTEYMAVPCGGADRLSIWPGLAASNEVLQLKGIGWKESCGDIVLSSAGWVAVTAGPDMEMSFRVWTPSARGIHLRQPALLPCAINFRGKRITNTPTYERKHENEE